MSWPTTTIVTTDMDASTDDASQARSQIKQTADNVNAIMNARDAASGIPSLDGSGLVPLAEIPTIPATQGGTGLTAYTIGDILYASAAGVLSKLSAPAAGQVLTGNGVGAAPSWQAASGGFPSGTRMLFQQTTAPTAWTKETNSAYNDVALRIVTGTVGNGGTDVFSTIFGASKSSGATTLSTAQMPSHTHTYVGFLGSSTQILGGATFANNPASGNTGAQGGGGSHSHTLSLDLKYRDVIIASKD